MRRCSNKDLNYLVSSDRSLIAYDIIDSSIRGWQVIKEKNRKFGKIGLIRSDELWLDGYDIFRKEAKTKRVLMFIRNTSTGDMAGRLFNPFTRKFSGLLEARRIVGPFYDEMLDIYTVTLIHANKTKELISLEPRTLQVLMQYTTDLNETEIK